MGKPAWDKSMGSANARRTVMGRVTLGVHHTLSGTHIHHGHLTILGRRRGAFCGRNAVETVLGKGRTDLQLPLQRRRKPCPPKRMVLGCSRKLRPPSCKFSEHVGTIKRLPSHHMRHRRTCQLCINRIVARRHTHLAGATPGRRRQREHICGGPATPALQRVAGDS